MTDSDVASGSDSAADPSEMVALAEEAERNRAEKEAAKEAALAVLKQCGQCGTSKPRGSFFKRQRALEDGMCIDCCGGQHQRSQQPPQPRRSNRLTLANIESHRKLHTSRAVLPGLAQPLSLPRPLMTVGALPLQGDVAGRAVSVDGAGARSVATSMVDLDISKHAKQRMMERGISKRSLQRAVKHASHEAQPSTGGRDSRVMPFEGTTLVANSTRTTAVTAWREPPPTSRIHHPGSVLDEVLGQK